MAGSYTLKELRNLMNKTQEEVAKGIGINRAMYSHYENGLRIPRVDVAFRIAQYFNVRAEEIIFLKTNDTISHN